jgi:hypothetical protein
MASYMTQDEIIEMARQAGFHKYSFESQIEQFNRFAKLVTEKQQRTWVGLTDEENEEIQKVSTCYEQAIELTEAKLKDKNL